MTTAMTRQQLVAHLTSLCCVSFLIGFMSVFGLQDWLRGNVRYWTVVAIVILLAGTLAFALRRFLISFQPKS